MVAVVVVVVVLPVPVAPAVAGAVAFAAAAGVVAAAWFQSFQPGSKSKITPIAHRPSTLDLNISGTT